MTHPGKTLRKKLAEGTLMCPGAWNGLVATAIAKAGFQSCYISGGATANSSGYPDIGLITLTEMCRLIHEVVDASGLPVIVDADTGYGEIECLGRAIVEYDRNGAAGMHIEDQEFPKRCGHLEGKTLISQSEMVEKVKFASKSKVSKDFILIVRTDANGTDSLEAAINRGCAYRDAGADMIFPEGLRSEEEFRLFSKECSGLLLANMTEFGKTPHLTAQQFESLGYELVIYPVTMQRVAMGAITRCLSQLIREGSAEGFEDQMQTRQELYDLLGYVPGEPWRFRHT
ncbi:MAG: isocitrate lyase/phosphoenolpyruvate mutase family protein [Phycisphaerales bacterium]|jgi:methylisocitrate lyase|nr:isocitrate lyase/phosphoenolpyruvate mutase family protein [Phycisphaerales bacterium]MDP6692743.1 isocitrate lyase/phosphoenolpyruvate mutase family protein [Phycisphaerales bacterium]